MFRTEQSVRTLQAVAVIAGLAVLLWSLGLPNLRIADAANVTNVSDTLSTSATSTVSSHEIVYKIPATSSGVPNNGTITVTFPSEFTGTSSVTVSDIDLEVDTGSVSEETLVAGAPTAGNWGFTWSGDTMTLTAANDESIAANATVTIKIGSNADGGTDRLVNPSTANTWEINLTSGPDDTGATRVVTLSTVTVTASVDTVFNFSVSGLSAGANVNGTTTTGDATATAVPFGLMQSGAENASTSGQLLTVTTNASQGYTVTVQIDHTLLSSTGADIDLYNDTDTPTSWASPSPVLGNENTYGHWGLTTSDTDTKARTTEFGADEWLSASTTPRVVMGHDGPADGTTSGVGTSAVAYKIQITDLQEAGDDYEATLTYVATPTF